MGLGGHDRPQALRLPSRRSPSGPGGGSGRFPRDKKALGSSSDRARTSPEASATLCTVEYAMAAYRWAQESEPEPEPQRASWLTPDPRAARTAAREGQDESALHSAEVPQGGAVKANSKLLSPSSTASRCHPSPGILAPTPGSFALLSIPAHYPTLNPFLLCERNSLS